MNVVCVGGGPANLYLSILLALRDDGPHQVTVYERDRRGSTYGFGVVLWEDIVQKLHQRDPISAKSIGEAAFRWDNQVLAMRGQRLRHLHGHGYSMRRQTLLDILQDRAITLGVQIEFEREITELGQLPEADLVVIGDGANSRLRDAHADRFNPHVHVGRNKYLWLGTTKVFREFEWLFADTKAGWLWCHAYGTDEHSSTLLVECTPETWSGLGFADLSPSEGIARLEDIFSEHLDGNSMMSQTRQNPVGSFWRNFPTLTNQSWHWDNKVLVGDAAHTTHFSIGSGTRLAMEDAIALADNLERHDTVQEALPAYEHQRRTSLVQPQSDARLSSEWLEHISRYSGFAPEEFFALLRARRSPLLPRVPPSLYYRLDRQAESLAFVQQLRNFVGHRTRAFHQRKSSESPSRRSPGATSELSEAGR
jgi:2-polyprenyl-6-methoxyphenol hydroxylase-like FAD-dependent oxidoreductase